MGSLESLAVDFAEASVALEKAEAEYREARKFEIGHPERRMAARIVRGASTSKMKAFNAYKEARGE